MIRLTIPSIDENDINAVAEVLKTGFLVQGKTVADFENVLAEYTGTNYAVAVSNCTSALYLSLCALNIGSGDLVITTPYSWAATSNVIELCGATPVFADIDPDTFNIDPKKLKEKVEEIDKKGELCFIKAILPVHTFGNPADMDGIMQISTKYNIPVIEDAACALGAKYKGKLAGTIGKAGCFSFHPRKAITTGEGGMVITDDDAIPNKIKAIRNHGLDPENPADVILPGHNMRLTEFQAAFGISQMKKLDRIIDARRKAAAVYDKLLEYTDIKAPVIKQGSQPVYQSYVVMLPDNADRDKVKAQMLEQGIETTIGTIHIPMTKYYREKYGYSEADFPVADKVFRQSLTLPLFETISEEEQGRVIDTLKKILGQ